MLAIVLAAGRGKRLSSRTRHTPKPLLLLEEKPLLAYSLDALAMAGIERTVIVLGYLGDQIRSHFGETHRSMALSYRENDAYASTSSMHSLSLSADLTQPQLVLDGDIIYSPCIIPSLIAHPQENVLFASRVLTPPRGDEYYVVSEHERVHYIGKSPPTKSEYECTGIAKLSCSYISEMIFMHEQNSKKDTHCEEVLYEVSQKRPLFIDTCEEALWGEIDTVEDLSQAKIIAKQLRNSSRNQ